MLPPLTGLLGWEFQLGRIEHRRGPTAKHGPNVPQAGPSSRTARTPGSTGARTMGVEDRGVDDPLGVRAFPDGVMPQQPAGTGGAR